MFPVPGVLNPGDMLVTSNSSPILSLAVGTAVVAGTTAAEQRSYLMRNASIKTLQPPGPPSSANRYDAIFLTVLDGQITGLHVYQWEFQCLSGAEAASPLVPATPKDSILLAYALRKPGAANILAADLTDARPFATPALGPNVYLQQSQLTLAIDAAIHSGSYYIPANTPNAPMTAAGLLIVDEPMAGQALQRFVALSASGEWARRMYNGVWGAWAQIASAGFALGVLGYKDGPVAQTDAGASYVDLVTVSVPVIQGRRYRATAYTSGIHQTAAGNSRHDVYDDQGTVIICAYQNANPVGYTLVGTGVLHFTANSTRTANIKIRATSSAGTQRFSANSCHLQVDDVGIG
jgi:hypothetical protein